LVSLLCRINVVPVKPDRRKTGPGRRGRPAVLSRDHVLTSALRIVDEHGIEGLTMRRLGAALGVDPMAIYHHVPDKAALFDGLVERVLGAVELPEPTGRWDDDVRSAVRAVRATFLAHPYAIPLLGTRPPATEAAFDVIEAMADILLGAGFTPQQAADGVDCAARLLIGHTLAEAGQPPGGDVDGGETAHEQTQQSLPIDRYPSLGAIELAGVPHSPDRLFELALDGLLLVLAAQRAPSD
jgi:TetR/AcrR family transcriptional regulator, tetracycline repressor protein